MDSRKSIDSSVAGLMVVLCVIWGLSQALLKLSAPDISPLMHIALRSGIAAALVFGLMISRKEYPVITGGPWRAGALVGGLFGLEFLLIGEGLRHTTASHLTVFLYTAPVFAALGLHWLLPSERLNKLQWLGIALAFSGIAVTFLLRTPATDASAQITSMLYGDLLALGSGLAWGMTTVAVRCSALARVSAAQTLFYQLSAAFIILTISAYVLDQTTIRWTPMVWGNLIFQSVVVCFASYLTWFWLLRHYMASRLGVFSFLTPLFGVGFGFWLLDETLETSFIVGACLVISGIILVSGSAWFVRKTAMPLCTRLTAKNKAGSTDQT